jgi:hypothetical protein
MAGAAARVGTGKGDEMASDRRFKELEIIASTDKPTLQPCWFA